MSFSIPLIMLFFLTINSKFSQIIMSTNVLKQHYVAQMYENFIGFATYVQENKLNVDIIQGISSYGVLLKIHKQEISGYVIEENQTLFKFTYFGLAFARFRIISLKKVDDNFIATVEIFADQINKQVQDNILQKNLMFNLKKQLKTYYYCRLKHRKAQAKYQQILEQKNINKIIYHICSEIDASNLQKLKLLQIIRQDLKIQTLLSMLTQKIIKNKQIISIDEKVQQDMQKNIPVKKQSFKQVFSGANRFGQVQEIQQILTNKQLPENVRDEIQKQMKRLDGDMQANVSLKYVQTLLQIPWFTSTDEVKELSIAQKILNQDHTGLFEVKERILQFLAVHFRKGNTKGNIICLHGPPGVGKTSIAKSIAKAIGKQFTRVSLGGMHDEAQLRGHRRTYVAAMPGVIVRALIKAKSNNPVILLDQIEKIGKNIQGNPQHALLQILDPSQNSSFKDHYVGLPVDLSKVMFICTANSLDLSTPLLNRLQLIQVLGYTQKQKLDILKNHLLPNQLKQNGVQNLIEFEKSSLQELVKYTNQMGVRQLERNLAKVCRKIARKNQKTKITPQIITKIFGPIEKLQRWSGIGVVNCMVWTQMGEKLLIIETIKYPNSKSIIHVTGQHGDMIKESINIALSWMKANRNNLKIWCGGEFYKITENIDQLQKISLHLHFPAAGIKKDGTSAGVAIITCLLSLLLKIPVRQELSMTGEITLSGQVLSVGRIREKCITAINEGIKHIIIPRGNLQDLAKIPAQLKQNINFYPVRTIPQILGVAFPRLLGKIPPKI